ncbi:phenylalanine--tRNA ligase subunit alpha [Flavobacteriales bacterium]|nr:phenylalanine--tRNA ligase subunit alpha [Flavobacteriales bacterium]
MINNISEIIKEAKKKSLKTKEETEAFRLKFLGKSGILNSLFNEFKNIPNQEKKEVGQMLNELKALVKEKTTNTHNTITTEKRVSLEDLTKPVATNNIGSRHPLSIVEQEIVEIFSSIGFSISEGPEIEDDWHNFTALNVPKNHPARDMQDTFFIQTNPDLLLRTHTSSVQARYMQKNKPPIRTISPGRVYRNEAVSSRAHCLFHQIEGLYIDKDVSFADLKQTLLYFAKKLFGKKSKIRLRPSYFPFTEPSAEVDIYWGLETESDYRITKGTGWLEILGCGMVDPAVLENCGIDSKTYTGFAFGMGIERIAMLKYKVDDLRLFYENDIRFLNQFSASI